MEYAKHIGRVGALAVTLGVGVALASAPGVANAEPTSSSTTSDVSSTSASPSDDRVADTEAPSDDTAAEDAAGDGAAADDDEPADEEADGEEADEAPDGDIEDSPPTGAEPDRDSDPASSDETDTSTQLESADGDEEPDPVEDLEPPAAVTDTAVVEAEEALTVSTTSSTTTPAPDTSTTPAPAPSEPTPARQTLVDVVSDVVNTLMQPPSEPAPSAPLQVPAMLAALGAVRDEMEKSALRKSANAIAPQSILLAADGTPNVLLIGVDGVNLSRVLADPDRYPNIMRLIRDGTTAPASIVGHTTISNPSWTSVLTGVWGERTGVINNVFTPATYDRWPTVFDQLESQIPFIQTTAIANWNVIAGIADAGSGGADTVVFVPQVGGDTDWLLTDNAVGDATEAAIVAANAAVANFLFSYFVGVDENGHLYGGASPEYADALENFDRNLGEILADVDAWESVTGEQWTILMVTDHGHQPQKGLGHGFQSPDETSTFVIAENPLIFTMGAVNLAYEIVDMTPTVVALFGGEPAADADGVSILDLDDSTVVPADGEDATLINALQDVINKYGYPDIGTNLALSARTIFATIPYYVDLITNGLTGGLQSLADQEIFLISPLARLAIVPVEFIGNIFYAATNIVAQVVARLTGVTGASIFPLFPPEPPFSETPEDATTPQLTALVCNEGRATSAVFQCGAGALAV